MTADSWRPRLRVTVLAGRGGKPIDGHRPVPGTKGGQVLTRRLACGAEITLENVSCWLHGCSVPRVMGQEFGGMVETTGPGAIALTPDDRDTASFSFTCDHCEWCGTGRESRCGHFAGSSEAATAGASPKYGLVPSHNLVQAPDGLSPASQGSLRIPSKPRTTQFEKARGLLLESGLR